MSGRALEPLGAVPLPSVGGDIDAAEEHHSLPIFVESHRRITARRGLRGGGLLPPPLTVPLPGVREEAVRVPAEEHHSAARGVVRDRRLGPAGQGVRRVALEPRHAIPLPGLRIADEHHARAPRVPDHQRRVQERRRRRGCSHRPTRAVPLPGVVLSADAAGPAEQQHLLAKWIEGHRRMSSSRERSGNPGVRAPRLRRSSAGDALAAQTDLQLLSEAVIGAAERAVIGVGEGAAGEWIAAGHLAGGRRERTASR